MKKEKIAGLERNVFFTGLTSFLTDTSTKMIYSVMPLFLLSIGASKTALSLIEGIAESTASLLKAVSGIWSDKIGKNKPFLIIGYGITALVTPLYARALRPFQVLVFRFLERIGKGIRTAPRDSLIAGTRGSGTAGRNFGFHKAMDNSGAILGPLVAFFVLRLSAENYRLIFLLATIPAVLGVINIVLFVKEAGRINSTSTGKFHLKKLPSRFYFFLAITVFFSLGNSTDALLLVRTAETGVDKSMIPFIYMIFNTASVIVAIPAGKLSDRIGREILIISGFLIYALVYALFGTFNNIWIFGGLFVLYGIYSALTDSSQKALVADLAGPELKGSAFGIYHAVLGITLLPASLIAGLLYDRVSSSAPFWFGAVMAFTAALLMLVYTLRYRKSGVRAVS
ncbi:MAG: MFS transporter [Bacteroidota bacterium]